MNRFQTLAFPFISPTSFYNVAVGTENLTFRPEWAGKFKERDMGHTPTPWAHGWGNGLTGPTTTNIGGATVGGRTVETFPVSRGEETIAICPNQVVDGKETGEANAAYIVECVNSHASLVEEVERLREVIDQATEDNRTVRVLVDALTEIAEIPTVNGETEEWRMSQELRLHERCRMIARRALEKSNA